MSFLGQCLKAQKQKGLHRELRQPRGVDFSSNDYLGLLTHQDFQQHIQTSLLDATSGSGGSRLLRGHQSLFEYLEAELAQFSQQEAALFFPSGYQCNLALLSAIGSQGACFFSDELNHASLIDGIKLSGASKKIFKHNDLADLRHQLQQRSADLQGFVVVESLYSMTGDSSPLLELFDLCEEQGVQLIVDEAHQTGVESAGRAASLGIKPFATTHTAGKSLGVSGAWVAGSQELKEFLVNFSRPFIYSTAPSPIAVKMLVASLEFWKRHQEQLSKSLQESISYFSQRANELFSEKLLGEGPIFYLVAQNSEQALSWSMKLHQQDLDVRAIRYPTVPENQAGLRISIHANHTKDQLDQLLRVLGEMAQ